MTVKLDNMNEGCSLRWWARLCPCISPPTAHSHPNITPFRREKLLFEFNTFIDINRDGVIEKRDLDGAAARLCKRGNWRENDPRTTRLNTLMNALWLALKEHADTNKDDKITRLEWLRLWEDVERRWRIGDAREDSRLNTNNEQEPAHIVNTRTPEWIKEYFNYKFMLLDAAGDGVLDEEEFIYIMTQYGASDQDAKNSWFLLAQGRRQLDMVNFERLCEDFFLSDDPTAPGTYLAARLYFLPGIQNDTSPP